MSAVNLINDIDQSLINRAKHNIEGLESLKQYFLEFIDKLDKKKDKEKKKRPLPLMDYKSILLSDLELHNS